MVDLTPKEIDRLASKVREHAAYYYTLKGIVNGRSTEGALVETYKRATQIVRKTKGRDNYWAAAYRLKTEISHAKRTFREAMCDLENARFEIGREVNSSPHERIGRALGGVFVRAEMPRVGRFSFSIGTYKEPRLETEEDYYDGFQINVSLPSGSAVRVKKALPYLNGTPSLKRGDHCYVIVDVIKAEKIGAHIILDALAIHREKMKGSWTQPELKPVTLAILPTRDPKHFIVGIGSCVEEATKHNNLLLRKEMREVA